MGADAEEYYSMGYIERPGKKPSLHSRLQNGILLKFTLKFLVLLFYVIVP